MFAQIFTDYEGGGAISIANDFMLVSYSIDFQQIVGVTQDLDCLEQPGVEVKLPEAVQQSKFEIWQVDIQSGTVPQKASP